MQKNYRYRSLDSFRGLTVGLMILVNSTGTQGNYELLRHATWNGCTLADLVFPFFIFIVGASLVFTVDQSSIADHGKRAYFNLLFKKSILLIFWGLFLNMFPTHWQFANLRLPGVLQRLALCYFTLGIILLYLNPRKLLIIALSLLIAYSLIMAYPNQIFWKINTDPCTNLASILDQKLFLPSHLLTYCFDPEGLLTTLPSLATAIFGAVLGSLLKTYSTSLKKLVRILLQGAILSLGGIVLSYWQPFNKSLWTPSYTLWTAGLAMIGYALFFYRIEIKEKRIYWLELFGKHSLLIYVGHILLLKLQFAIAIQGSSGLYNLKDYLIEHINFWHNYAFSSLIYGFLHLSFWFLIIEIGFDRHSKHKFPKVITGNY